LEAFCLYYKYPMPGSESSSRTLTYPESFRDKKLSVKVSLLDENSTMEKKLNTIIEEYNQLKRDLSDPKFVRDPKKIKQGSQRFNQIEPTIKKIEQIQKIEKSIMQINTTLVDEKDQEIITLAHQELKEQENEKKKLESEIEQSLKTQNPYDSKNIIMEIRAGTGGDEAALFAAKLFRMYSRFAELQSWKIKIISSNKTSIGGFKEIIFEISGANVYGSLKYESGTHRVQRIPETEKSGRLHTSAVTVAVLPEAEDIDLKIDPSDITIDVFKAGGHGGQSVNTTDSAVRITHIPTGLIVNCQDERSQQQNKIKAMQVLRSRLLALKEEKRQKELREKRKIQIGTGDRSEKIRTYNFPQDRITDHRIKKNWHNIEKIMDGNLDEMLKELKKSEKANGK